MFDLILILEDLVHFMFQRLLKAIDLVLYFLDYKLV